MFTQLRDTWITRGFNRRVATLYARLQLGIDTFESIALTPSFSGKPLLSRKEIEIYKLYKLYEHN